jgi:hypothetical protein
MGEIARNLSATFLSVIQPIKLMKTLCKLASPNPVSAASSSTWPARAMTANTSGIGTASAASSLDEDHAWGLLIASICWMAVSAAAAEASNPHRSDLNREKALRLSLRHFA